MSMGAIPNALALYCSHWLFKKSLRISYIHICLGIVFWTIVPHANRTLQETALPQGIGSHAHFFLFSRDEATLHLWSCQFVCLSVILHVGILGTTVLCKFVYDLVLSDMQANTEV